MQSVVLHLCFTQSLYMSKNDFTKVGAKIIASVYFFFSNLYVLYHRKIRVPIGLVAEEI